MAKEFLGLGEDTSTVDTKKADIRSMFTRALERQMPIALWRKPLASNIHMALSLTNQTSIEDYELENLGSGFLFCPFDASGKHEDHFIKDDILVTFDNHQLKNYEVKNNSNTDTITNLFTNIYNDLTNEKLYHPSAWSDTDECASEDEFKEVVKVAINEIAAGRMTKVVPARCKSIDLDTPFSIIDLFTSLESGYPNAFVYIVAIPEVGTWLGATPENLISVDEKNVFKTTALAGTQRYEEGMSLTEAAWRQKEIEEQALVSRYIINCLKRIRLREFEEIGPKTVRAGNLIHLKTDFIVDLNEVHYPLLPTVMLKLLHPTSAICGMPKEPAQRFISDHEHFDRSFFSGFLGPVNIDNHTNVFVNIRCMQFLEGNKAAIYAGAGVTADSAPEKEWEETELKMETLLQWIKKSK